MIDSKTIEDAAKKICDKLPGGLKNAKSEFEANVKNILHATFSKLDLVTREEFDQQVKVLKRCDKKIKELEEQLKKPK